MIDDLDKTLEQLIKRELASGLSRQVAISFAPPDSTFATSDVTLPAINLFLYDIRENTELRSSAWTMEHQDDGTVLRKRAPVRVDCSYLVTAWASEGSNTRVLDEHRLLSEVIRILVRHETIPEAILQEPLRSQDVPLPACVLGAGRLTSPAEFWQAIGGKPKAAFHFTVTLSMPSGLEFEGEGAVLDKRLQFGTLARKV